MLNYLLVRNTSLIKHIRRYQLRTWIFTTTRQRSDKCLTSCQDLSQFLQDPLFHQRFRILDATWNPEIDCKAKFLSNHIPYAHFFDLEECKDMTSPYPLMLPPHDQFADYVTDLGIGNEHHVVIYDNQDEFVLFSATRLWWMFRVFGYENVSVLNGGFKRWLNEGNEIRSGDHIREEKKAPVNRFKTVFRSNLVKNFEHIEEIVSKGESGIILEARLPVMMGVESEEYDITDKSVPGATLTPFNALLDPDNHSIRSKEEIAKYFTDRNIDVNNGDVVSTCEIGLTASILSYCLYYACAVDVPVYDGSFTEWSHRNKIQ